MRERPRSVPRYIREGLERRKRPVCPCKSKSSFPKKESDPVLPKPGWLLEATINPKENGLSMVGPGRR